MNHQDVCLSLSSEYQIPIHSDKNNMMEDTFSESDRANA